MMQPVAASMQGHEPSAHRQTLLFA